MCVCYIHFYLSYKNVCISQRNAFGSSRGDELKTCPTTDFNIWMGPLSGSGYQLAIYCFFNYYFIPYVDQLYRKYRECWNPVFIILSLFPLFKQTFLCLSVHLSSSIHPQFSSFTNKSSERLRSKTTFLGAPFWVVELQDLLEYEIICVQHLRQGKAWILSVID